MKNINLFVPTFRNDEIITHISECLDKGWTGLGYKTVEIENLWKSYSSLPNAHFLNSNTSGLHLAIKILKDSNKWNDGDEIITTPLTFVSTNHAIMYERMKPVFADVDEYLCLDPESVRSRIGKKTRAVLFVGMGGNTGRYSEIVKICKEHKLKLILDAAHMSGTKVNDSKELRHIGWDADVCVFSFQAVKNLPTSDSGMICFNNDDYDALARKLSWLGIDKDTYQRTNEKGSYKWEYDMVDVAFKKAGIESIKMSPDTIVPSRHLYQIVTQNRNKVMEHMNINGIYPGVHYRDNTNYKMYKYAYGTCPYSHNISEKLISLPLHMKLTDEDVEYVIEKTIQSYNLFA